MNAVGQNLEKQSLAGETNGTLAQAMMDIESCQFRSSTFSIIEGEIQHMMLDGSTNMQLKRELTRD